MVKFVAKPLLLTVGVLFFITINAQEISNNREGMKKQDILEKFSLTPQVGLLHSWSDFNDDGLGGFLQNNELGINLLLNFKLNSFLTISAGGLYGSLSGRNDNVNTSGAKIEPSSNLGFGILFNTDLFELTLPRVDFNVTSLIFKDNSKFFNKFSVGIIASHGLIYSNSKIYAQEDEGLNLHYVNASAKSDKRGSSGNTVEAVTSYGLGLSYVVNDRFDIGVETTIRNVWNDRLDSWETEGSANDKYSFTAIGFTYYLKKRKSPVPFPNYAPNLIAKSNGTKKDAKKEKETLVEGNFPVTEEGSIPIGVEESKEESWEELSEVLKTKEKEILEVKKVSIPVKEAKASPNGPLVYEGSGYFIAVGAFRGLQGAKQMMDEVSDKGEKPTLIRNSGNTWYIITIAQYEDKSVAINKMLEKRKVGYPKSWVHVK